MLGTAQILHSHTAYMQHSTTQQCHVPAPPCGSCYSAAEYPFNHKQPQVTFAVFQVLAPNMIRHEMVTPLPQQGGPPPDLARCFIACRTWFGATWQAAATP